MNEIGWQSPRRGSKGLSNLNVKYLSVSVIRTFVGQITFAWQFLSPSLPLNLFYCRYRSENQNLISKPSHTAPDPTTMPFALHWLTLANLMNKLFNPWTLPGNIISIYNQDNRLLDKNNSPEKESYEAESSWPVNINFSPSRSPFGDTNKRWMTVRIYITRRLIRPCGKFQAGGFIDRGLLRAFIIKSGETL